MNKDSIFYHIRKWWSCSTLPDMHIFKSKTINDSPQTLIRHWFIHPVKRRLAKYYLTFLRRFSGIKVIGITGSAGKTTTKEMLVSILENKGNVIASYKNIDPVYNIPSTILRCTLSTKYLILEMGVEYPGEMDFYIWLAKPDVGVITNIYPTHTEYFSDTNGVFKEKRKLAQSINSDGVIILNNENLYLKRLKNNIKVKMIFFGNGEEVSSSQEKIESKGTRFLLEFDNNPEKRIFVMIPTYGKQFVYDSLAASAVGKYFGFTLNEIKYGLESYTPQEHRMTIHKEKSGAIIIDDTYNNNPNAAIEALNTLREFAGAKEKIVVFGDMLELGKLDKKYHEMLGIILANSNLKKLVCIGNSVVTTSAKASKIMGNTKVDLAKNINDAVKIIRPYLNSNTVILIKGSRSLGLDRLVNRILR